MRTRSLLLAAVLASAACTPRVTEVRFEADPAYRSPGVAPRSEAEAIDAIHGESWWSSDTLEEQLAESDVVFVGRVVGVGRSPGRGVSCFAGTPFQMVVYEVEDVWKSRFRQRQAVVAHPLYDGSRTVLMDPIRLNPAIWQHGARLIVWAGLAHEWSCGAYGHLYLEAPWDTPGPLPATPALLERVRGILAAQPPEVPPRILPRPTPEQAAWHDLEVGMFVHLAPQTWQDSESDDLSTPLEVIDPKALDTDQWVAVAESMGARYIVFVAKHEGGFCWWQTDTTGFSVRSIPWRGGKGDVLADLSRSCRERGMKLGVYVSPQDRKHGVGVGGRAADPAAQAAYEALFRRQLVEVLTRYGEMMEVWFDGSLVLDVSDVLREHAPRAMVFQGPSATIRWVGNEDGIAPDPCWNGARYDPARWGTLTAADGDPDGDRWLPSECDARLRATWFWKSRNEDTLKSVEDLVDMYERSVGRGAVLLLNSAPDTTGRIPEADARRCAEFGAEIRRRYDKAIEETDRPWRRGEAYLVTAGTIDRIVTMEDISGGERVRRYVIEGLVDREWKPLVFGTAIGRKRIDRIPPASVGAVRLRVLESVGVPKLRRFAVYDTRSPR